MVWCLNPSCATSPLCGFVTRRLTSLLSSVAWGCEWHHLIELFEGVYRLIQTKPLEQCLALSKCSVTALIATQLQLDLHIAPVIQSSEAVQGLLGLALERVRNRGWAAHSSNNERTQCA